MLTQCWSCPCKATDLPFPPETISVGISNEKPGPGAWSGAASGCHFQRAEISQQGQGFPFSTRNSIISLLQLQLMVRPEMCFQQALMPPLPHNRQLLLAVKSTLFSLLSEGFCFPSKSLVFSNVSKLLMSPGSQNSWYLQGHKVLLTYSGQFKQTYPLGARP